MNEILFNNYLPTAFWAMEPTAWQEYVGELEGEARQVLSHYPFKWAFAPPCDSQEAVDFLRDIGVDDGRVSVDLMEEQLANLPTFESLVNQGSVDWEKSSGDEIPPGGFRMIPEWEPMAWLGVQGVDLTAVRPIPGPVGDIWARDYSPIYGVNRYTGEPTVLKFAFAAFYPEYRERYRHVVEIDNRFAWTEGFRVYRTEMMYDGGYLLTDGNGTYVMTRRVLSDNAHISNLYARLEAWLGAERLIIIDEEPGDALGHINHVKFISPQKVLVGLPDDENSPVYRYHANLHKLFTKYGYEVIVVPCPVGKNRLLPMGWHSVSLYANSLLMNHRVLLCQSGTGFEKYDEQAIKVYREALPDYEIIPIDCSLLSNGGGGINCATHEIPDISRLVNW